MGINMAQKSGKQSNSRRSGGSQTAKQKTEQTPKTGDDQNVAKNPQETQQSVSPSGLSDQVEAQRNAENNFDEDGYPVNATRPKPENWNDMSDDEKRAYVYASSDGSDDVQIRQALEQGDNPDDVQNPAENSGPDSLDAQDKNQSQEHTAKAGVNTDPEAPYGEGDGADNVEMGSNEYLAKSGKGQLFGNGPETVNVTNHAKKIAPPEGRILRDGEETTFSGTVVGQMAVVDEDVFREVYPRNSKRPSYVLVYVKGTAVPLNTLNALGINTDEAQAKSLVDDEEQGTDENADKE